MSTPRAATINEIADELDLSPYTVKFHRGKDPDRWRAWEVGTRKSTGRGRPQTEYNLDKVVAYYRAQQPDLKAAQQDLAERWPNMDEIVELRTIGERLGLNDTTVASYPTLYRDSKNPFPDKVARGRWRWGDIVAWHGRRRGSGRREPHTPESGVDPGDATDHLAALIRAGTSLRDISEVSEVPVRTLQRLQSGELQTLSPDYEIALLTLSVKGHTLVPAIAGSELARLPVAYRAAPVSSVGLPTRVVNALEQGDINTVGQLAAATDTDLQALPGLEPAGMQDVRTVRARPPVETLNSFLTATFAELGSSVPTLAEWLGVDPESCLALPPVVDHIVAAIAGGESSRSVARRCQITYNRLLSVLKTQQR